MSRIIATVFGIGLIPFAPGTWGSLVAIPMAYGIHYAGGFPALLVATVAVYFLGLWATTEVTRGKDNHDPSEIVIDEVAGQWTALLGVSAGLWFAGVPSHIFPYPGWVSAFVLFRLFDIWKPWLVGWADRKTTPTGVMLDDVIAGLFAMVLTVAAAGVAHGLIMK